MESRPALQERDCAASVIISEVSPWSSSNSPYLADWFEVTNTGNIPSGISGWKMDDNSNSFVNSVALRGVTKIPAGKSAILFEGDPRRRDRRDDHRRFLDSLVWNDGASRRLTDRGLRRFRRGLEHRRRRGEFLRRARKSDHGSRLRTATAGFTFDNKAGLGSRRSRFRPSRH